jgi:hypothetical protein
MLERLAIGETLLLNCLDEEIFEKLTPVVNVFKTFFFVKKAICVRALIFENFQLGLILPFPSRLYYIRLERLLRDKHSSLFVGNVSDDKNHSKLFLHH